VREVRLAALVRAIETRFPGVHVEVEPWTDPDGDETIRWWLEILRVRDRDRIAVHQFTRHLSNDLYGPEKVPLCFSLQDAKGTAAYLARRKAEALRDARLARARKGHPATHRRAVRSGRS